MTTTPEPRTARRLLTGVGAALLLLLSMVVTAGPAAAEPDYPPQFNQISASRYTVFTGQRVVFKVQTFVPRSAVTWTATLGGSTVASGTSVANARGLVVQQVRFVQLGVTRVSFSGTSKRGNPLTLSANVTVRAKPSNSAARNTSSNGSRLVASGGPSDAAAGGLPVTGGQVALTLGLGMLLVLAGGALLLASRRRRI